MPWFPGLDYSLLCLDAGRWSIAPGVRFSTAARAHDKERDQGRSHCAPCGIVLRVLRLFRYMSVAEVRSMNPNVDA